MSSNPGNVETLRQDHAYPIADECWTNLPAHVRNRKRNQVGAVWTGRVRQVRKGDWFLSGALIEAYYAPNDLSGNKPRAIADLVSVQIVHKQVISKL